MLAACEISFCFYYNQVLASIPSTTTGASLSECTTSSSKPLTIHSGSGIYSVVTSQSSLVACQDTESVMARDDSSEATADPTSLGPVYVVDLSDLDTSNGFLEATDALSADHQNEVDCAASGIGVNVDLDSSSNAASASSYTDARNAQLLSYTTQDLNTSLVVQTTSPKSSKTMDESGLWNDSNPSTESNMCFLFRQADSVIQLLRSNPDNLEQSVDAKALMNVEGHVEILSHDQPVVPSPADNQAVVSDESRTLFGSYPSSPVLVDKSSAGAVIWRPVESLDIESGDSRGEKHVPGQFDQSDFVTFDCNILLSSADSIVSGADGLSRSPRFPSPVSETHFSRTFYSPNSSSSANPTSCNFSTADASPHDISTSSTAAVPSNLNTVKSQYEFGQLLVTEDGNTCPTQSVSQFLPLIWCYPPTNSNTFNTSAGTHHVYTTTPSSLVDFPPGTDQCSNFSVGYLIGQNRDSVSSNPSELGDDYRQSALLDCGRNVVVCTTASETVPASSSTAPTCSPTTVDDYFEFDVALS